MAKIGIVYFSGYGHTKKQAEAVRTGAASATGAEVHVVEIGKDGSLPEGTWAALAAQDANILGSPTYRGGVIWKRRGCMAGGLLRRLRRSNADR